MKPKTNRNRPKIQTTGSENFDKAVKQADFVNNFSRSV